MTRTKNPPSPQILQLNELIGLNDRLTKLGINVVYLKGILDHLRLTGKLPLRPKFDIDLLVKKPDFKPLAKLFLANGYSLFLEDITNQLPIETAIKYPQVTFLKTIGKNKIIFDVHFLVLNPTGRFVNLLPRKLVKKITAEVFLRRQSINLFHHRFNMLEINDLFLISCLSFFFHHRCQGKSRLNDIAIIDSSADLNRPLIAARARRWHLSSCIFIVIKLLTPGRQLQFPVNILINRWTLTHPIPRDHLVNRALSWSYAVLLRLAASTAR